MGSLERMNGVALEIASRDDSPFPKSPDTMVFDRNKDPKIDPLGQWSPVRTSRVGIAELDEIVVALFGDEDEDVSRYTELQRLEKETNEFVGEAVTGFIHKNRTPVRGVMACMAFWAIHRTADTTMLGLTEHDYVGSLWVPIDYAESRIHTAVYTASRSIYQGAGEARVHGLPTLVFGNEAVEAALTKQITSRALLGSPAELPQTD